MSATDFYLVLAAVLAGVTAGLFAWAALLIQPRYRRRTRNTDRHGNYAASVVTYSASRR